MNRSFASFAFLALLMGGSAKAQQTIHLSGPSIPHPITHTREINVPSHFVSVPSVRIIEVPAPTINHNSFSYDWSSL